MKFAFIGSVLIVSIIEQLSPREQNLIIEYLRLVIEANEDVNLTRIDTLEEGMILHVEDSLVALQEVNAAPLGLYGDLGSGGGFPGVPIAIASGRNTVLVDARQKKMQVLDNILLKLGLQDQIQTYAGRAELLAKKRPEVFSVVSARALAKLPILMELASPLLIKRGRLVCYKAHLEDDELNAAAQVEKLTGMKMISDRSIILDGDFTRRILVFEKFAKPRVKLPRREGAAQKIPLTS